MEQVIRKGDRIFKGSLNDAKAGSCSANKNVGKENMEVMQ